MRVVRRAVAVAALALVAAGLTGCAPERVYTYRIATRGPVTADVGHFTRHVAATLSDPRGWSLGGAISFRQTTGPANFTIWLATAASVPTFSSGCSSQWSCRAGANVIINETRWQHATPAWPYNVASYRHYVVNHEVGHWLGLGHRSCTAGAGQRAPVMVQQSKGGAAMGACRFNVWPLLDELYTVARTHRVSARPTGLPSPDDPFGSLDSATVTRTEDGKPQRVRVVGWAIDGDTTGPIPIALLVDGIPVTLAVANGQRPDVGELHPYWGPAHGYDLTIDVAPTAKNVCVNAFGVNGGAEYTTLGCRIIK